MRLLSAYVPSQTAALRFLISRWTTPWQQPSQTLLPARRRESPSARDFRGRVP